MKTCPVTGRIYRNSRELAEELNRLDKNIEVMQQIEVTFHQFGFIGGYMAPEVGDAWNMAHDALSALQNLRSEVARNPLPLTEADRASYELAVANID